MWKWPLSVVLLLVAGTGLAWLKFNSTWFLSTRAEELVAQVQNSFSKIESAQAAVPPPNSERETLEQMYDLDQCGRQTLSHLDFSVLPEGEREIAKRLAWNEIEEHDRLNQRQLKKLMPKEGWFRKSVVGDKASDGVFYVVQHAGNDQNLMRVALARMGPLLVSGEVDPFNYARLYDRVTLFFDHKPQRYGTQFTCKHGMLEPSELEDVDHVDERRKSIDLTTTLAQNIESIRREQGLICR